VFTALRADFDRQAGRSLAMPIAGAIAWTVAAVATTQITKRTAILVLVFGTMFPIALAISSVLNESG
jgi:hypothetical protein